LAYYLTIATEGFFMEKGRNYEQRYGTIGGRISAFLHKKASVPPGCGKIAYGSVEKLAHSTATRYAFLLAESNFSYNAIG